MTQWPKLLSGEEGAVLPRVRARRRPRTGRSVPDSSIRSDCSDRLIRTTVRPHAAPSACTNDVLPHAGEPSSSTGLRNRIARSTRKALARVVGACSEKAASDGARAKKAG